MIYNEVKRKGVQTIKVKEIRKKLKVSPEVFASELGLSKVSYYNRLHGQQEWKLSELVILAELLKKVSDEETVEIECDSATYSIQIDKVA